MSSFTGNPQDLAEKITYELEALEFLRRELFDHTEKPDGSMDITLGDLAENGNLRATVNVVISESISASAVGTALSKLKPLAFSACFKLHDMIVEWILRANECTDWQFSKKISTYKKLKNAKTLTEPDLFVQSGEISEVFWGLYQSLVSFRNPISHSGGTRINADGAIEIERHESVLILTHSELGSYIRAMSIIANHYIGSISIDPHLAYLLNFDLSSLKKHHDVALPNPRTPILTKLNVEIPAENLESITPIKTTIDFGTLRQRMLQTYSPDDSSRLFYSTYIRASTAVDRAAWLFPIQTTPFGVVTLTVGDEQFDKYLVDF